MGGILLVMGVVFIFCFLLSLLESAWLKIGEEDIVRWEMDVGQTKTTQLIRRLLKQQPVVVSFILLLIFVVLSYGTMVIGRLTKNIHDGLVFNVILILYPIILFYLGEIVPKIIGIKYALTSSLLSAKFLHGLMSTLHPISWLIRKTMHLLGGYEDKVTEADVAAMARAAAEHGALHPDEADIVNAFLAVNNRRVGSLMTSLHQLPKVPAVVTRQELKQKIREVEVRSHILIVESTGPVVGYLSAAEALMALAEEGEEIRLTRFVKGMVDLSPEKTVGEGLSLLLPDPLARVVDPHGKVLGVFLLERIIQEVFR